MKELKGIDGLIRIEDFLTSLNLDTSEITLDEAVKLKNELETVLLNNDTILKLIK